MAITIQLLKQVRNAAATINATTDNPEYKALLSAADLVLNELMLQESPDFYLQYIAQGKALLAEGRALAVTRGTKAAEPVALRASVSADLSIAVINAEIAKLHDCMLAVVQVLEEDRSAEEKAFLMRMSDWETSIYNHSLEQVKSTSEVPAKSITRESLQAYLAKKFPDWKNIRVTKFMTLDGGFSKKTILFEIEDDKNGPQSLVIRAEQPVNMLCYEGSDVIIGDGSQLSASLRLLH